VHDKVALGDNQMTLACAHEARLTRIWESQEEGCATKQEFVQVMSFLWGLEGTTVQLCIDFKVCIEESLRWVRGLEEACNTQCRGCFSSCLAVSFSSRHYREL
jgi:hypothetical protein